MFPAPSIPMLTGSSPGSASVLDQTRSGDWAKAFHRDIKSQISRTRMPWEFVIDAGCFFIGCVGNGRLLRRADTIEEAGVGFCGRIGELVIAGSRFGHCCDGDPVCDWGRGVGGAEQSEGDYLCVCEGQGDTAIGIPRSRSERKR